MVFRIQHGTERAEEWLRDVSLSRSREYARYIDGKPLVPDTINSSIDSLKEISRYFSVSIDELLSGDQLVLIAEKENKSNLNGLCDLLFGFTDLLSLMLIFLPLYSKPVDGYIYSVSLIEYVDNEIWIRMTYWGLFIALTIIGIVNILMVNFKFEKGKKVITFLSVGLSIITVLYLAIAREPYAVTVAFLLLLIKGGLLYKRAMAGR